MSDDPKDGDKAGEKRDAVLQRILKAPPKQHGPQKYGKPKSSKGFGSPKATGGRGRMRTGRGGARNR